MTDARVTEPCTLLNVIRSTSPWWYSQLAPLHHCLFAMLYTIWCIILGETTPFSVKIDQYELVDVLKDRIMKEKEHRLDYFPA